LRNCLLCCGLAGIVTIKKAPSPPDIDPVLQLAGLLEKIVKNDLQSILSGALATELYLDGGGYLEEMERCVRSLKTDENFQRLFFDSGKIRLLSDLVGKMKDFLSREERLIDENAGSFSTGKMETINGRLVLLRDITWAAGRDILGNVEKIVKLSGAADIRDITAASLKKYNHAIIVLNCLDRLEVRGRDSAGVHITFALDAATGNRIPEILSPKGLGDDFFRRRREGDLINGSISFSTLPHMKGVTSEGAFISFTYKTSSIVGELGLNTASLIKSIREDRIFHELSKLDTISDAACVHTRWASVGSITEENCHPVNNFTACGDSYDGAGECSRNYPFYGKGPWTISVALNGDIDNYRSLRSGLEQGEELIAPEVTTDTKIIPLIIEKYLTRGDDLRTAFRRAVNDFEGSHAIAMVSNVEPDKVFLALRGSGQSLYVGIAPDQYIFSSELYGIVEVTPFFLKMAGEGIPEDQPESAGQICVLDQNSPGGLEGISAFSYDGALLNLKEEQIQKAEITTRDIDRGNYPHYFLKEITESTLSVKKTLRGKYRINRKEAEKSVLFNLGEDVLPLEVKTALTEGSIARIMVIGHGTAAVAGEAIACAMNRYLEGSPIKCEAKIASELSGFCLSDNLRDTLIIAITQSGTTTDTNRAVAMAVERGARVVAIVNRRQSDICTKAQGVFYTSDGRDIEMSVASTKAFYSQIVAGHILALYLAQLLKIRSDDFIAEELGVLEQAPALMTRVLDKKEQVRLSVEKTARQKRYWAVVGSGPNKTAADEIRIKLSELCYRTISSDVVENKKHIDLSAEPLIIVCTAGNPETVLGDIIKDVAIFKAHKACVVVIADEGEERFHEIADAVIEVPRAPLPLSVILNTLAGHLWGYFAACYIDEEALFFREFRSRLNMAMAEQVRKNYSLYEKIADREFRRMVREFYADFNRRRQNGAFSLTNVKTSSDMVLLLKYASGTLPLDDFWHEFPGEGGGGFASPLELLDITMGMAIDELSRPIDAIRHQAKTVTVGTSRKEPTLHGIIFDLLKELEFSTKALNTKNILSLTALQPAIGEIRGYTLYDVGKLDREGNPTDLSSLSVSKRGGISLSMKSRVEASGALMGTKRTIVSTGHIYVGCGKSDGASIVIMPLLEDKAVRNLLLIHVIFNESLTLSKKKDVLGYRYNDIRNLINEYNLPWDDRRLENIPLALLLGEPVEIIAERIRQDRQGIETQQKQ